MTDLRVALDKGNNRVVLRTLKTSFAKEVGAEKVLANINAVK